MTRLHSVVPASGTEVTMYPNSAGFSTTDVFLGAGFLKWIQIIGRTAQDTDAVVTVYDGVVVATNRYVVGGTVGTSPLDRWRVIAGGALVVGPQGDIHVLAVPNAQLTACRVIHTSRVSLLATLGPAVETILIEQPMKAMAVHVSLIAGVFGSVNVGYIPHTNGGTRRRQFYRPGSTVKVQPPLVGDLAL